jgi:hypothetical protein
VSGDVDPVCRSFSVVMPFYDGIRSMSSAILKPLCFQRQQATGIDAIVAVVRCRIAAAGQVAIYNYQFRRA